ncbi:MAG: hypothetical protein JKY14_07275 [Paraglaciecola sp.]|nr:hypothetical protein [Paraglaciecola sp.]
MRALNSKIKNHHLIIVVVWISFTVLAFAYFAQERLVIFDVNNKLQGVDHLQLAHYFQDYSSSESRGLGNKVIHFSKPNCACQKFSQKHILDLNQIAENNQFSVVNVVVEQHAIIPATPSVAILDESGDVIYYGPYGQGLGCSETSGFAQTMLNNFLHGFSANVIISEAKGCYCHLG